MCPPIFCIKKQISLRSEIEHRHGIICPFYVKIFKTCSAFIILCPIRAVHKEKNSTFVKASQFKLYMALCCMPFIYRHTLDSFPLWFPVICLKNVANVIKCIQQTVDSALCLFCIFLKRNRPKNVQWSCRVLLYTYILCWYHLTFCLNGWGGNLWMFKCVFWVLYLNECILVWWWICT